MHYSLLEFCCREHLNAVTPRCMAVLDPIKVVITDYPEDKVEEFEQPLHPEDESFGSRKVPFCREIWIDRDDFREDPPKKYFRLAPGVEVRLRYAYYITCQEVIKDENGNYHTLAASTSHTLSVSVQTSDVSTKDENDLGANKEVTGKSVTLSTENLVAVSGGTADITGKFLPELLETTLSGTTLEMSFGYYESAVGSASGSDSDWGNADVTLMRGSFLCTSVTANGSNKENATYSAEFACKGMPSVGEQ